MHLRNVWGGVKCNMTYDQYIINSKELYHFGIKGMRWGVRRYQNEDGSLTGAGKKRYAKELVREFKFDNRKDPSLPHAHGRFEKNIRSKIKTSISKERVDKLRKAKKLLDRSEEDFLKAEDEYDTLVEKYSEKMDLRDAYNKARREKPDLLRKIQNIDVVRNSYLDACEKVAEDIVGEYADMPIYGPNKSYIHTLRDAIGVQVGAMIDSGEIDMNRKIR